MKEMTDDEIWEAIHDVKAALPQLTSFAVTFKMLATMVGICAQLKRERDDARIDRDSAYAALRTLEHIQEFVRQARAPIKLG
jgi:hypothetical protein